MKKRRIDCFFGLMISPPQQNDCFLENNGFHVFSWIEMSFDMKEDSLKQKMVCKRNVVFFHEKYQFLYHSFSFWIGRLYHLHFELKSWIQKSKIFYLPSQKSFSFFLQFQLARHFIRHWRLSKAAIIQLCYMKSALNLCV